MSTGSLTTTTPGHNLIVDRPPNVSDLSVATTIPESLSRSAMRAAPISTGDALNAFDGGLRQVTGELRTAVIFATYPQPFLTVLGGFIDQVVGTALLMAGDFWKAFWATVVLMALMVTQGPLITFFRGRTAAVSAELKSGAWQVVEGMNDGARNMIGT